MKKLRDDCFLHDKDRMRHDEALQLLQERLSPIAKQETTSIEHAANKILAQDIVAPRAIPATDNSAVDGYAFAHDTYLTNDGKFNITERIAAGDTRSHTLAHNSAARIFTGAPMPSGADSVAMQEDCEIIETNGKTRIHIPAGLKPGANRRKAGEDVLEASIIAEPGKHLRPQELAAIASTGNAEFETYAPLRIGLASNGDEILRPGAAFTPGQVYDSNFFMLHALLQSLPVTIHDLGVCRDDSSNVKAMLEEAAQTHDVILSTGGASRGEEDHLLTALEELGYCHMWQLAIKPGRPMGFGQISNTPCFVLPGNPVAAFVCFLLYVRPSLGRLGGGQWMSPVRYSIPANFEISSKPDRREFLRGYTSLSDEGVLNVEKFERDGSGLITGLRKATGLIEIPEETKGVVKGELVSFMPFSEFGIT